MDIIIQIVFWAALLGAALYDAKNRIIPDTFPAIIAITGLFILKDPLQSLWGGLIGGGILLIMALINTSWVGGGDVKLLAGMGVGFGWTILWILWIACLFGLVASLAMKKKSLPFAPFLFVGAFTVALANHIPDFL